MAVYLILEVEVTDRAAYEEYLERVTSIIEKYGGRYLVRGGNIETFAGDWKPGRIVVLEFPSHDRLKTCFASPEYAPLRAVRERGARARGIVVESCQ